SDQSAELPVERQRAHVGQDPGRLREAAPAPGNEGSRRIDANNGVSALEKMAGDGLARSAPQVQYAATRGQQRGEALEPFSLEDRGDTAIAIPGVRLSFVQLDDLIGPWRHRHSSV